MVVVILLTESIFVLSDFLVIVLILIVALVVTSVPFSVILTGVAGSVYFVPILTETVFSVVMAVYRFYYLYSAGHGAVYSGTKGFYSGSF